MTSPAIQLYFISLQHNFIKYYVKVLEKQRASNIHKLRLTIKKLRAFLLLVEESGKTNFSTKKHYLFLPIFKSAGKVRELQINLQLFKDNRNKPKIIKAYKKELASSQKNLIKELYYFDLDKYKKQNRILSQKINKITHKQLSDNALNIFINEMNHITAINNKKSDSPNLHKARIHLRKSKEMLILLGKIGAYKPSKKILKSLDQLYTQLGEWHDQLIFVKSLESTRLKLTNKKNIDAMIKTEQQKEHKMKKRLNLVLNNLDLSRKIVKLESENFYHNKIL
jgi:CHAD domain-containing protein